jgi:hypothetical protein
MRSAGLNCEFGWNMQALHHGMCVTHADQVNADLLAFLKG